MIKKVMKVPLIEKIEIYLKFLKKRSLLRLYPAENIIKGRTKVKKNTLLNWNPLKTDL